MEGGFAAARQALGTEMHGVVHRITRQELDMLDKIEVWYIKDLVKVVPYDHEKKQPAVNAFVYVFDPNMIEKYPEKFAGTPSKSQIYGNITRGGKPFQARQYVCRNKAFQY
jgi:gamma-glutamylcyclotransferase (GGCT)/AIG2-like uncharacterized protein YtfP